MKLLIIDNYDSFTFNLYQQVSDLLADHSENEIIVKRNDAIHGPGIKAARFDGIIISPGPGTPESAAYFGVSKQVVTDIGKTVPVLGVCLGMQGIASYWGGRIARADEPRHGKTSIITHDGKGVFAQVPQELEVMRYHSLVVDPAAIPDELEVTATVVPDDPDAGTIMGIRHRTYPIEGVQFHPESFRSEAGKMIVNNFIMHTRKRKRR